MTTQTQTKTFSARSLFDFILYAVDLQTQTFTAADLGYEISAVELANVLAPSIYGDLNEQIAPQVSANEFDAAYKWFIS
jgi:hypothetical protein